MPLEGLADPLEARTCDQADDDHQHQQGADHRSDRDEWPDDRRKRDNQPHDQPDEGQVQEGQRAQREDDTRPGLARGIARPRLLEGDFGLQIGLAVLVERIGIVEQRTQRLFVSAGRLWMRCLGVQVRVKGACRIVRRGRLVVMIVSIRHSPSSAGPPQRRNMRART